MKNIRPIVKGENLIGYASNLAHELFEGIVRDTGLPYTQDHLNEVANLVQRITIPSRYQAGAVAAGWLHDSAEDISFIDVYNPFAGSIPQEFCNSKQKTGDIIFLNDLLRNAGDEGEAVCYMVDLMTHRKGTLFQEYIINLFNFPVEDPMRQMHILAACNKVSDRRKNTNPDESKNVNDLVKEYLKLDGADIKMLEAFYKRTKTIDAFIRKNDYDIDVGLFVETIRRTFQGKQRANAVDNLSFILPLAERKLLVEAGENNGVFNYQKMRQTLKELYIDSLELYPGDIYEIKKIGLNKGYCYPQGYTPILKEIRRERAINGD
jgi:hypothetical protein